ncbi:hypothetical protein BU16DRAFT_533655 [Lophium mytilinum]|uniref:Uncharacterized protein n=1 Tax=Lophium mytilinum TaxID=390894 RepID=A0A6A6RAY5_9PEZI|nr:hypothetical protein BU16DRAFT_533655 [Lophium mytilinum]
MATHICRGSRSVREAQAVLFANATFQVCFTGGGSTAHFWLPHSWNGKFDGPPKEIKSILKSLWKLLVVILVRSFEGQKRAASELESAVQTTMEREEGEAVKKCLNAYVELLMGRELDDECVKRLWMPKEMSGVTRNGGGGRNVSLEEVVIVFVKKNPWAIVTRDLSYILDNLSEMPVEGKVRVKLECGKVKKTHVIRETNGLESAVTDSWPGREMLREELQQLGKTSSERSGRQTASVAWAKRDDPEKSNVEKYLVPILGGGLGGGS